MNKVMKSHERIMKDEKVALKPTVAIPLYLTLLYLAKSSHKMPEVPIILSYLACQGNASKRLMVPEQLLFIAQ